MKINDTTNMENLTLQDLIIINVGLGHYENYYGTSDAVERVKKIVTKALDINIEG